MQYRMAHRPQELNLGTFGLFSPWRKNLRASPREIQRFLEMVRNNPISNFAC